jgi:hypothetical protein
VLAIHDGFYIGAAVGVLGVLTSLISAKRRRRETSTHAPVSEREARTVEDSQPGVTREAQGNLRNTRADKVRRTITL